VCAGPSSVSSAAENRVRCALCVVRCALCVVCQDAVDYLSWTFFFRRLLVNPSYYNPGMTDTSEEGINKFLIETVRSAMKQLEEAGCLTLNETDDSIEALSLGKIVRLRLLCGCGLRWVLM
jgi:hypothetical protein